MTTATYFFSGITKWCKVRKPDEKYENFQVPLYMDTKSWDTFQKSDCQLKKYTDNDGDFVVFKRNVSEFNYARKEQVTNGPPEIHIKQEDGTYIPFPEGLIGNGSSITVRVDIYDTRNGKGHRLVSVGVDKLVEYAKAEGSASQLEMPF